MSLLGFDVLRPWLALGLLLLPLLAVAVGWGVVASRRQSALLVDPGRRARFWGPSAAALVRLRGLLACVGLGFLCLAWVGPVRGHVLVDVERQGLDLVVCLDASRSMLAEDAHGRARIGEARTQVKSLFEQLPGDRVALLSFSGDVRKVAPLTRDLDTLERFLDLVEPGNHVVGGTNLAAALEGALELLDERSGAHEAVVLITDGEDHEGRGLEVAQEAAERNIRVHVLGVGSEAGAKIPLPEGGFQKDADGRDVVTHLDPTSLRAIADATDGELRLTERNPLALYDLYRAGMGGLEGRTFEQGKERVPLDRFQWFLVPALLCLAAAVALPRRGARPVGVRTVRTAAASPDAAARPAAPSNEPVLEPAAVGSAPEGGPS